MRLLSAFVVFLLCAFSARALGGDQTLQEARLDLMGADSEGAAGMYASWLEANLTSAEAPVIFNRYFSLEQNLPLLMEAGKKFLAGAQKGAGLSATMARIARLFEVAGKAEDARDAYLSAFARGETSALESAFLVSLEMNDVNALQSALSEMKNAAGEKLELLAACIAFQKGDIGPAEASLIRIASTANDQSVCLRALWMSYEAAVRCGDSSSRQQAVKLLGERFPRSPEYAIVVSDAPATRPRTGPGVTLLALPGSFLIEQPAAGQQPAQMAQPGQAAQPIPDQKPPVTLDVPGAESPRPPESPPQSASPNSPRRTLSVQAGSFQMKENADDLIGELTRKGFSPTLRIDALSGKPLYRVFAGKGLSVEEARVLLDRLHQAGFSGYLLSDSEINPRAPGTSGSGPEALAPDASGP